MIEDRGGDRIAWTGSLNETAAGWQRNWESINVATSWGPEPKRVACEEDNFARLWANRARRAIAENAESVELWSPGNPLFRPPDYLPPASALPPDATLPDLLER